jgi:hypothetical protein
VGVEVNFVMRGTAHPVRSASLTAGVRDALLADLACHNCPIQEVLCPAFRDISGEYDNTLRGVSWTANFSRG